MLSTAHALIWVLKAFWNNAFDVNRTFVISDETDGGTPIGIDFFEMRRRVPSDLNENVRFQYGPYGKCILIITRVESAVRLILKEFHFRSSHPQHELRRIWFLPLSR